MKKERDAKSPGAPAEGVCERCGKTAAICLCDRIVEIATKHDVLVLQHPQEQDVALGSVPLLLLSLPRARRAIGLSWSSLQAAIAQAWKDGDAPKHDANRHWAVLYPASLQRVLSAGMQAAPLAVLDAGGAPRDPDTVRGIVVIDGTWSQVKTLWWRNPWLLKVGRVVVHPREPSIYGRARREPKREYVSTLEAVALTLEGLGEDPAIKADLHRLFRTMVQRARDHAPAAKKTRRKTGTKRATPKRRPKKAASPDLAT